MSVYLVLEGRFAEKKKWWWFPYIIKHNVLAELPLIIGPFFIGSIWILKYTFDKLNLYLLVNLLIDSLLCYGLVQKGRVCNLCQTYKISVINCFLNKDVLIVWSKNNIRKYL